MITHLLTTFRPFARHFDSREKPRTFAPSSVISTVGRNLVLALLLLLPLSAAAQSGSTKGTEFWVSFFRNDISGTASNPVLAITISAKEPCSGTISNPRQGWSTNFTINTPNSYISVPIDITPINRGYHLTLNSKGNFGLLVTATKTVSVYAANGKNNSSDASNILPVTALSDEYIVQTYQAAGSPTSASSCYQIIATEAGITTVDITPFGAPTPTTITLNRGECYLGGTGASTNVSGTKIKARGCAKIAVFNGSSSTNVPYTNGNYDGIFNQAWGTAYWGKQFVLTRCEQRTSDRYRITVSVPGTIIKKNGVILQPSDFRDIINGTTYEIELNTEISCYIETDNPSAVYQYLTGATYGGTIGDPSMVWISPIEQMMDEITFATYTFANPLTHYVNIVSPTKDIKEVKIDGVQVTQGLFTPVTGKPDLSYCRPTVSAGAHTLKSDSGFLAIVYGLRANESYAYSVGSRAKNLTNELTFNGTDIEVNDIYDYCLGQDIVFKVKVGDPTLIDTYEWDFGDGNGSTSPSAVHNYATEGTYPVTLTITYIEQNPCNTDINFEKLNFEVTVHTLKHGEEEATGCDFYIWNGITYDSPGDKTRYDLVHPKYGCDSTATLHLTINPTKTTELNFPACISYTWEAYPPYDDEILDFSDTYFHTYTSIETGCDSIVTLNLTINQPVTKSIDGEGCDFYIWKGFEDEFEDETFNLTGSYERIYKHPKTGCDSTVTLNLTIHPSYTDDFGADECDFYIWKAHKNYKDDVKYTETGNHTRVYNTEFGCDSTITLNLTIRKTTYGNDVHGQGECKGTPFVWAHNGKTYFNNNYTDFVIITNLAGCDSILTLNLTFYPNYNHVEYVTLCEEDLPTTYGGIDIPIGTTAIDDILHLKSIHDCDSIVGLHLRVLGMTTNVPSGDTTICQNDCIDLVAFGANHYLWRNNKNSEIWHKYSYEVCPKDTTTYTVYGWMNEDNLLANGNFEQGNVGFDSEYDFAVDENSMIEYTYAITNNPMLAKDYLPDYPNPKGKMMVINGGDIVTAKVWEQTVPVAPLTDYFLSASFMRLNDLPNLASEFVFFINDVQVDEPFKPRAFLTWNDATFIWKNGSETSATITLYNLNPTVFPVIGNESGMDDIYFGELNDSPANHFCSQDIVVNVNKTYKDTIYRTDCDAYVWKGKQNYKDTLYKHSGTYLRTYQSVNDCDSIVTLILTINPSYNFTENFTVCDYDLPYRWKGIDIPENVFEWSINYGPIIGCDSIWNLNLTVMSLTTSDDVTTCDNECVDIFAEGADFYSWNTIPVETDEEIEVCPFLTTTYTVEGRLAIGNLIFNGDFDDARGLFKSDYDNSIPDGNLKQFQYAITDVPNNALGGLNNTPSAKGNMMVMNSGAFTNAVVWEQTITNILPNTDYELSASLTRLVGGNPHASEFLFTINGNQLPPTFIPSQFYSVWDNVIKTWNSGASTSATISIYNLNNHFLPSISGIDDLSFKPSVSTPDDKTKCTAQVTVNVNPTIQQDEYLTICYDDFPKTWRGHNINDVGTETWDIEYKGTSYLGCDSIVTLHVTVLTLTIDPDQDVTICKGESVTLTADGATYYLWMPGGETTASVTVSPLDTTTYTVTGRINEPNLLKNGDFEKGNTLFVSGYDYCNYANCLEMGKYSVTNNPKKVHSDMRDFNNPTGQMLVINGGLDITKIVWQETVTNLDVNEDYILSAAVMRLNESDVPNWISEFEFRINGVKVGTSFKPQHAYDWSEVNFTWENSKLPMPTTSAIISLYNLNPRPDGNDAGIDNIYFAHKKQTPDNVSCEKSITVNVNPTYFINKKDTICQNDLPYTWLGNVIPVGTTSGDIIFNELTINGCDSTVILSLIVNDSIIERVSLTICQNDLPYPFRDINIIPVGTTTREFTFNEKRVNGCDSIVILNLTVKDSIIERVSLTICQNELPYDFCENIFPVGTESGIYTFNEKRTNGCDSIVILTLTVNDSIIERTSLTICQNDLPFTWRLKNIFPVGTESDIYTFNEKRTNGCDSIVILTLTVNDSIIERTSLTICQNELPLTWRGNLLDVGTISDDYTFYEKNILGCDSIVILTLTVNDSVIERTSLTICQNDLPFTWRVNKLFPVGTTTGEYIFNEKTYQGCDSIVILTLTVNDSIIERTSLTICQNDLPFTWRLNKLFPVGTESDIYTFNEKRTNGCDSIVILTLTVNDSIHQTEYLTICKYDLPYDWRDITFDENTITDTYIFNRETILDCDSIVTLYLTVLDLTVAFSDSTICKGDCIELVADGANNYFWSNNVNSDSHIGDTYLVCPDTTTTYTVNGYDKEPNLLQNGNLHFGNNGFVSDYDFAACANCLTEYSYAITNNPHNADYDLLDSVSKKGNMMVVNGGNNANAIVWKQTVTDLLPNEYYLLSASFMKLNDSDVDVSQFVFTINGVPMGTFSPTTYYDWNNVYFTWNSGLEPEATITLYNNNTSVNNNDSGIDDFYFGIKNGAPNNASCSQQITVFVNPVFESSFEEFAHDSYIWEGFQVYGDSIYLESDSYYRTYKTINNCDSIVTLRLIIYESSTENDNVVVRAADLPYEWHGFKFYDDIDTAIIRNAFHGLITYNLMLRVLKLTTIPTEATICDDDCVDLVADGGDYYLWSTGETSASITVCPTETTIYTIDGQLENINLLFNGNFEKENNGIKSDYKFAELDGNLKLARYTITNNPIDAIATLQSIPSIRGDMMLINGAPKANAIVWQQKVAHVEPNTDYILSGAFMKLNAVYASEFAFVINDDLIGTFQPSQLNDWDDKTFTWYSGDETSATISLYNLNTANFGNESGIDDLCFKTAVPAPTNTVYTRQITVNVNPTYELDLEKTDCDKYTWVGHQDYPDSTHTISGEEVRLYQTIAGCDSLVTLTITINPTESETENITACDSLTWRNGIKYTESISDVEFRVGGVANDCDSVYILNLTIDSTKYETENLTTCDSLIWRNGETYTSSVSNIAYRVEDVANGCDSVYVLFLTIDYTKYETENLTSCDSLTWRNGIKYTASISDVEYRISGIEGECDTVYTLFLTIDSTKYKTETLIACDSLTWRDGIKYTTNQAGIIYREPGVANNCDSVYTLMLTINASSQTLLQDRVCQTKPYSNYGFNISPAQTQNTGEYPFIRTLTNALDCDSTITLKLRVDSIYSQVERVQVCLYDFPYRWRDTIFELGTQEGIYRFARKTECNCDSIVQLVLTIKDGSMFSFSDTVCQYEPYQFGGISLPVDSTQVAGNFLFEFKIPNASKCDSLIKLNLFIAPIYNDTIRDFTCVGQPYIVNGETKIYFETGLREFETFHLSSIFGCDSSVKLYLDVLDFPSITISQISSVYCADSLGFEIPMQMENAETYSIEFNQLAIDNGFVNVGNAVLPIYPQTIVIEFPVSVRPNNYNASIIVENEKCGSKRTDFNFTINYPSKIIKQKWNDVLGVLNAANNGGFTFSSYQWYKDDNKLNGETKSYLYVKSGLENAEYKVRVRRADDGVTLFTCPITPEYRPTYKVHPQLINSGEKVYVECAFEGTVIVWNILGQPLATYPLYSDRVNELKMNYISGVYLIEIRPTNEDPRTVKVVVK